MLNIAHNPVAREQASRAAAVRARLEAARTIVPKPQPRPFQVSIEGRYALLGIEPPIARPRFSIGPDANDHYRAYLCHKMDLISEASHRPLYPSVPAIIRIVSALTGVSYVDIVSARRTGHIIVPRQVAMRAARNLTPRSLPQIGKAFGGRDHTTVLHACRKIDAIVRSGHEEVTALVHAVESAALETVAPRT